MSYCTTMGLVLNDTRKKQVQTCSSQVASPKGRSFFLGLTVGPISGPFRVADSNLAFFKEVGSSSGPYVVSGSLAQARLMSRRVPETNPVKTTTWGHSRQACSCLRCTFLCGNTHELLSLEEQCQTQLT